MTQQYQSVGIIEIDAHPQLASSSPGSIGEALRELRRAAPAQQDLEADPCWDLSDDSLPDSVIVLKANLQQLHWELENELTKFIDRLLACS